MTPTPLPSKVLFFILKKYSIQISHLQATCIALMITTIQWVDNIQNRCIIYLCLGANHLIYTHLSYNTGMIYAKVCVRW